MRVLEGGEIYLLDRHLERLSRSARHFSFTLDAAKTRDDILKSAPRQAACLRLMLSKEGVVTLQQMPLPTAYAKRVKLSSIRVNSNHEFLFHKTTNRGVYEAARRECDDETDALLSNERGEITETTIMNVAVFRDGRWITPQVSCGLLSGVMREELLARGEIVEGVIQASELQPGEVIRCFNALRGVCEAPFSDELWNRLNEA
jgi:para-aminobenzoate synthetase / 4-amino-4-deoxychorismate lyase